MDVRKDINVVIITPFNEIEKFEGGSRSSIKEQISYFDQFLILYSSIIENWKDVDFKFSFLVLHSIPFKKKKQKILNKLDKLDSKLVTYELHPTKIRPLAYLIDIDCDYRLVLDVDMYALKKPTFNFNVDAQAMYGGNKYNNEQWEKICAFIGADKPKQKNLKKDKGGVTFWKIDNHVDYHLKGFETPIFPYFNNGAILIKNCFSKNLGKTWEEYKKKYINYINLNEKVKHQVSAGQNMIGLAIDNVVNSWLPFSPGFNFILQDKFTEGRKLIEEFSIDNVELFHYINVPKNSIYEKIILEKYKLIRKKYYSKWQIFQ